MGGFYKAILNTTQSTVELDRVGYVYYICECLQLNSVLFAEFSGI
jgi:hypothetical protein